MKPEQVARHLAVTDGEGPVPGGSKRQLYGVVARAAEEHDVRGGHRNEDLVAEYLADVVPQLGHEQGRGFKVAIEAHHAASIWSLEDLQVAHPVEQVVVGGNSQGGLVHSELGQITLGHGAEPGSFVEGVHDHERSDQEVAHRCRRIVRWLLPADVEANEGQHGTEHGARDATATATAEPRAGDGNRTRMTSLEGWDSSH
ncbi:MAG: hypothetical protein QOG44_1479 [Acidimicrobiaceae bacterium]|nr:hypothetical protein [Acidimicrobiaceae bacterium]